LKRKFFIVLLFISSFAYAQEKTTTVILVRHAEKMATPGDDPVLNEQGKARADQLARIFDSSGIAAIYSSQYTRTRLTAEPLAKKLGLPVQVVNANTTNKLVESILKNHAGQTVLVVGHSNTLPEIAQALGAGLIQPIGDLDYDNLFIVTVFGNGTAKLLKMKFFAGSEMVCQ
jgi:broad specificity phosphatase PhoE